MAWNGSNNATRGCVPTSGALPRNTAFLCKAVIVGAIALVVAICLGLIYWTSHSSTCQPEQRGKGPCCTNAMEATTARGLRSGNPIKVAKTKSDITRKVAQPELTDCNPIVRQKALGRVVLWKHRCAPPVFTNRFESLVCDIMTAVPGEHFLAVDIEDEFDDALNASLSNHIVVNPDDSEDVKFLKQTVIDAKEEVRQLVMQGGSARDIVANALSELNKIADYRDKLQEAVNEYMIKATDITETLKFVKEANEILAEYGAMPVDGPDDEDTAYELMMNAKDEKLKELDEEKNEVTNKE